RLGDNLANDDRVTVGYAPAGWSNLADHLRVGGATDTELVDAGLAKWSRRGTLIDLMRDRVVFGIRNDDGDLVGFTGRAAPGDTDAPKWLNTPTTTIFTKGELLFGYTENRDRLADGAVPVRVEGVMDALAITMAGDGRAVGLAPLGTALTAAQADTFAAAASRHIILHATDDDPAGLKAAERDYWLLTTRGVDTRKLILTDGEQGFNDPADAYSAAPDSLTAALVAVDIAPPLAAHLISDIISRRREHLSDGNLYAVVDVARKLGTTIAAAPADQRDELIAAAAAMLADAAAEDRDHYLELVTITTNEAAQSWGNQRTAAASPSGAAERSNQTDREQSEMPGAEADDLTTGSDFDGAASGALVEQVHERLNSAATALAALRQSTDAHERTASTGYERDSGASGSEIARTGERHRREEDPPRGTMPEDPDRER
ncbi:toprim domain-containing protein, partial [Microlunatus ginsengisoli]|uniref:toprim domain-containing protein n=1 Tax=Microlunatus ginsengisoli TaxID=363863 RepID=UPI0031D52F61